MGRQSRGGGGSTDQDNKHEQKLQAVLLALDDDEPACPLSVETPKVLCSLNNVTLLDYAIEFLAGAGVKEVVVLTTRHQVEQHLQQHNTKTKDVFHQVDVIVDNNLTSEGDALRELDKRNIIKSDPFLLLRGDVITNVDIGPVLEAHKVRKKKDSSAIMTLLFKPVGGWNVVNHEQQVLHSSLRVASEDLIVGLDSKQENRVLVYDNVASSKEVSIPCSFFESHSQVELRGDLLDCGIDICSPDVLARFSDAFDYDDVRRQFVANSVAEEEEGLQNKIFAHVLQKSEYASRVQDFGNSYATLSRQLLQRWCYPVVPDNLPSGYEKQYRYVLQRRFLYKESKHNTKIGRSSSLQGPGMIGSQCVIQDDCVIQGTVIGNHCSIASHVTLRDCHLWDNVVMEEGVTATSCIFANTSVIKKGATIGKGCVIGRGCVIGHGITIPDYAQISLSIDKGDDDDDGFSDFSETSSSGDEEDSVPEKATGSGIGDDDIVSDHNVVGPDGLGRIWTPSVEDDDSDEDEDEAERVAAEKAKAQSMGYDPSSIYRKRSDIQKEDEEDGLSDVQEQPLDMDYDDDYGDSGFSFGASSDNTNVNEFGVIVGRQNVDVVNQMKIICSEHEMSSPIENLGIELNSYKFSQNATFSDCTKATMLAILERMNLDKGMGAKKLVGEFRAQLEHWSPLLRKMSIGISEEKSIISAIELVALGGGDAGGAIHKAPSFRLLLQTLHDEEVVNEAAILSWAADVRTMDEDNPRVKLFQQQPTQDFLEYLEQDSDDDDSEDSE